MNQLVAIAVGGAVGSVARFLLSGVTHAWLGRGFPYGTLAVNVIGSLMMGAMFVLLVERVADSGVWRAGLLIGLLGGFTTFSSFSIETLNLIEQGEMTKAATNVVASIGLCLGATWLGMLIGRQV